MTAVLHHMLGRAPRIILIKNSLNSHLVLYIIIVVRPKMKTQRKENGRFDIVVSFNDGTYGVIDFKTGNPSRESANLYNDITSYSKTGHAVK